MTHMHHKGSSLILTLVLCAFAGSPASAQPSRETSQDRASASVAELSRSTFASDPPVPRPIVRVEGRRGFDWGDAGIGGAAVLALAMIGFGAVLIGSTRRNRRAARRCHSTATPA